MLDLKKTYSITLKGTVLRDFLSTRALKNMEKQLCIIFNFCDDFRKIGMSAQSLLRGHSVLLLRTMLTPGKLFYF